MNYVIEETTKNKISSFGNEMVEIDIKDFNYLINVFGFIIKLMVLIPP